MTSCNYNVTPYGVDNSAGIPKQLFDNLTDFGESIFNFLSVARSRQYPLACSDDSYSLSEKLSMPHGNFAKQLTNNLLHTFSSLQFWAKVVS